MLASIALALLSTDIVAPDGPREVAWPSSALSSSGEALSESCDGSRTRAIEPQALQCVRWKIEWTKDGKLWGVTSASSLNAVVAERERVLGHARQHARLFDVAVDPRWSSPSAPICDTCSPSTASAAAPPSEPSPTAVDTTSTALVETRAVLARFETAVLDIHAPRLREIARLAQEPATSRIAKAYATSLQLAVLDLAHLQLELDNATVFRTAAAIAKVRKAIELRASTLDKSAAALLGTIAKSAARAHAGVYSDDASPSGGAQIVVKVAAEKVTATFVQGEAETQWFEGSVQLDGSIVGRSLVAPEGVALICPAFSLECGYVWAPAMLRFDDRIDTRGKRHTVELWFQQGKWVHARPFSR
ncbi:MAG: hypothetical protein IAG13_33800 [Deltaproteobacteria bacterium]|nr:hypothetical protein [Nannocystaceae bacterium]